MTRREWLAGATAAFAASAVSSNAVAASVQPKRVAAIVTRYEKLLHADVIVGKILEGWKQDGGKGPALKVVSMYVDQFGPKDLARKLSKEHGFPIFDTIEETITVGGNGIPVDGVISVGEHGKYPYNEKGQHLYPRRRFFKEITDTFEKFDHVVPVFNDKHLGPQWKDAKWMYDRAKQLKIPFMASSSLPTTFRKPDLKLPMRCEIETAVGVGYSGLDIYGFHTLDCYQCIVERRKGAESGVKSVQCLQGESAWKAVEDGIVDKKTLQAAIKVTPGASGTNPFSDNKASLFLFRYNDGFQGAVVMFSQFLHGISTAVKLKGDSEAKATYFEERLKPAVPHFAYLLKACERMIHTRRPTYPVERTLLSGGILDAALTSIHEGNKLIATPELGISYTPVDYPHAPHVDLDASPTS
ncbi:MAG: hypothetical protein CMJ78_10560 [Planctomycetaceae bacterium]|nr:hypothetical protein [Planctomycetaceae bacterium]